MADYKTCVNYDMDLCPMARKFANKKGVKLDCSNCKDYLISENKCGDCKHYEKKHRRCYLKSKSEFIADLCPACADYEERNEEMSVRKSCKNCKHYHEGFCNYAENGGVGCLTTELERWELSDDAKADLLHDAEPEHDAVNSPAHYTSGGIECIDCIKAALGENFMGFLIGNVIKYSYRYKDKNGVEDLKKARWYLDRAIKELENAERNDNQNPALR